MRFKGLFITFEGIDGCGKSTQLNLLQKNLKRFGITPLVTREPGGGRIAERIREVILERSHGNMDSRTELLLYLAARAQNVAEVVAPALEKGRVVLCDRFYDSTFAYQGGGRGMGVAQLKPLNRFACAGLKPDLTLLFDLPAKSAALRLAASGKQKDRMEMAGMAFQEKVRQAYLRLAALEPSRIKVLDAACDRLSLSGQVYDFCLKKIAAKRKSGA